MENERKRKRPKRSPWDFVIIGFLLVVLIAGGVIASLWNANEYVVELQLKGVSELTLSYGSGFADPGAAATCRGTLFNRKAKELEVQVTSNLNTDKIGTYTIQYTASYDGVTESCARTVHVVDNRMPVITLTSSPDAFTLPGQEYQEEGYQAIDDYDGDITDKVVRTETETEVIYTVSDSSGNTAEVHRVIVYKDPVPPVLTLKGGTEITLNAGTKFTDPGYEVSDNCDSDVTVTVSGSVDVSKAGTYTLTYTAVDDSGNTVTATRTVSVKAAQNSGGSTGSNTEIPKVDGTGKTIYLTFDDGPGVYTPELLAVLEKYNVKATFFVVNTAYIEYVEQIAAAGHAIGIHSKTHVYSTIYSSEEAYFADLDEMQSLIEKYAGYKTNLLRFPGGSSNSISKNYCQGIMTRLTKAVTEKGFYYYDWNVDSGDAGGAKTADEVFRNVANGCANKTNSVVLQHDIKSFSVEAVEKIIVWGLENGFTFDKLSPDAPSCHHRVNN